MGIEIYDTQDSRTRIKTIHICTTETRLKSQKAQSDRKGEISKRPFASSASLATNTNKEEDANDASGASDVLHTSTSEEKFDYFDIDTGTDCQHPYCYRVS